MKRALGSFKKAAVAAPAKATANDFDDIGDYGAAQKEILETDKTVGDSPGSAPHMLTDEERGWCRALRAALNVHGVPVPSSDLLLAQFAIIAKGDVQKGVERVRKYQTEIVDKFGYTPEAAEQAIGFMNGKWPGTLMPAHMHPEPRWHPTLCMDMTNYIPRWRLPLSLGHAGGWPTHQPPTDPNRHPTEWGLVLTPPPWRL